MNAERKLVRGQRLVVASHNAGKVREIAELLQPYGLDIVSAGTLGLIEPDETEPTFKGNAALKAVAAARASGLAALADDSGLEVADLAGAPGIYSARWAGSDKDFKVAMARVADEVDARRGFTSGVPIANFTCALCLAWPDGGTQVFEGRVFGRLVWPPRGDKGFGYDPMFVPEGGDLTFGEMEPEAKHAISHRAEAFRLFVATCFDDPQS